jgi:hypothetical protein
MSAGLDLLARRRLPPGRQAVARSTRMSAAGGVLQHRDGHRGRYAVAISFSAISGAVATPM